MDSVTIQQTSNETDEQFQHVKGAIESLLFVNEKPVTLDQINKALETVSSADIKKAILDLQKGHEEQKRGVMIVEIAGGYQMLSNPAYAPYLRNFYKTKHKEKLSKPALESMAIIAYKQPVTRSDVELIRGVNSDGVISHLLSKELIKVVGRKDVPGRPYIYGTTKQFLEYFGLKSLDDLPTLEEFPELQAGKEDPVDQEVIDGGPLQEDQEEKLEEPNASGEVAVEEEQEKKQDNQGASEEMVAENAEEVTNADETEEQDVENESEKST